MSNELKEASRGRPMTALKSVKEAADKFACGSVDIEKVPEFKQTWTYELLTEGFLVGHAHAMNELEDITNRYNALSLANAELEAANVGLREALEYILRQGYTGAEFVAREALKKYGGVKWN